MIKNAILFVSFLTAVASLIIALRGGGKKLAFVDAGTVYGEFKLTKELGKELENTLKVRQRIADSLYEKLRMDTKLLRQKQKRSGEELDALAREERQLAATNEEFSRQNQETNAACNEKIWKQLNQYLSDYGKENGLDFILGANGQGNILYGEKGKDITENVIAYINQRYEGYNK